MLGDVDDTRVTGPGCWVMPMIRGHLTRILGDVDDTGITGPGCWVMSMIRGSLDQDAG